jgi:phage terminase large subunit
MPIKPNTGGKFELYTKDEMKSKFKFNSPNLADSVMMLMRQPFKISQNIGVMPQPIKPIGRR